MDIICDTNIWYNIGNNLIDLTTIKKEDRLVATYTNIDEFSMTTNLIDSPIETRKAVQAMFDFSKNHAIFEPPLIYLKKQSDSKFIYDIGANLEPILTFTEKVAKGGEIELSKGEEYRGYCEKRREDLQSAADSLNQEAKKIKEKIKNNEKHKKEDSILLNRQLISLFVSSKTGGGEGLSADFDWAQIELFENTLKVLFNDLETGATILKPNDWYDLFILAYVSPGKLYWTKEKKWLSLIKKAKMDKYLYQA